MEKVFKSTEIAKESREKNRLFSFLFHGRSGKSTKNRAGNHFYSGKSITLSQVFEVDRCGRTFSANAVISWILITLGNTAGSETYLRLRKRSLLRVEKIIHSTEGCETPQTQCYVKIDPYPSCYANLHHWRIAFRREFHAVNNWTDRERCRITKTLGTSLITLTDTDRIVFVTR